MLPHHRLLDPPITESPGSLEEQLNHSWELNQRMSLPDDVELTPSNSPYIGKRTIFAGILQKKLLTRT